MGQVGVALQARGLTARDTVVIVPLAQHLPLARQAWSEVHTGWMPRIETLQTLSQALGPAPDLKPGDLSFELAADQLQAARLLRQTPWGRAWSARDAAGFESASRRVVQCAQEMWRVMASLPPQRRAAYLDHARAALSGDQGPGQQETSLARLALEWAGVSESGRTDALFALRPAAWVLLHVASEQPLATQLARQAQALGVPVLEYGLGSELDAGEAQLLDGIEPPVLCVCEDFEDEAQQTAAQTLGLLQQGAAPVALIAQDRALVRRVRALLERSGVRLADETGWKLSTTRAAAAIMGVVRAAHRLASTDALLDVLKSADLQAVFGVNGSALDELEAGWRSMGWSRAWDAPAPDLAQRQWTARALSLRDEIAQAFSPLREMSTVTLPQALEAWRQVLERLGVWQRWCADSAGLQVLRALHLSVDDAASGLSESLRQTRLNLAQLGQWADWVLEEQEFVPSAPQGLDAEVVITPLTQALARPFAAVVMPAADEQHLGGVPQGMHLLGPKLKESLGLVTPQAQRAALWRGFALLLRVPRVVILRRLTQADQPLGPSPLLKRLDMRMHALGKNFRQPQDFLVRQRLAMQPQYMPGPALSPASALWPQHLSAQGYEDLRDCPYRYFARHVLKLREPDELDDEIEHKDLGIWVHATLHAFHEERRGASDPSTDVLRLREIASEQAERLGWVAEDVLPHRLWLDALAPGYVKWVHELEADGQRYLGGELSLRVQPQELADVGLQLMGRIDRVDDRGAQRCLLDYKTSGASKLKAKVAQASEETQLTFYALLYALSESWPLAREHGGAPLSAAYVPLPAKPAEPIAVVAFEAAYAQAPLMLQAIAHDFRRLRSGAPLPALGQGEACEYCAMRGLCRRDDWATRPPGERQ